MKRAQRDEDPCCGLVHGLSIGYVDEFEEAMLNMVILVGYVSGRGNHHIWKVNCWKCDDL